MRRQFRAGFFAAVGGLFVVLMVLSTVVTFSERGGAERATTVTGAIAAVFLGLAAALSTTRKRKAFLFAAFAPAFCATCSFSELVTMPPAPVQWTWHGATTQSVTWGGKQYDVVEVPLDRDRIRILWNDGAGHPIGSLDAAAAVAGSALMITNAGIFEPGQIPTGLLVADGHELHPLTLADGEGNFYLKPNGVFFVGSAGAGILETAEFRAAHPSVESATQSGPMLLRRGALHPEISSRSKNMTIRSGVCVARSHLVYFAISHEPITFHSLATFFRDGLGCTDGLYLDGAISEMRVPSLGRTTFAHDRFAGLIVVEPLSATR